MKFLFIPSIIMTNSKTRNLFTTFLLSFSSENIAHQFLRDISKLIIVVAGKFRQCLLGNITELVFLGSVFSQVTLHPFSSLALDLLRYVTKLVVIFTDVF